MEKRWYVIYTYSGCEDKVKVNLERMVETMNLKNKISSVLVPTEDVIEIKDGKKKIVPKKKFPGYVLVEMEMDNKLWYIVRNTTGVTSFVGAGNKPTSLTEEEVKEILGQGKEKSKPKVAWQKGQTIQVSSGPFANFTGQIEEINQEKGVLKVLLSIFGRETPVELDFTQVRRI